MEVSGQLHAPAALPPKEKDPGTQWMRGWMGPRVSLDAVRERRISCIYRNRTPAVQPVANGYTDWPKQLQFKTTIDYFYHTYMNKIFILGMPAVTDTYANLKIQFSNSVLGS
jgi:hypothetical protein